jgi:hypothetical protein
MSDFNSSLPVRTQTDGDVVVGVVELPAAAALSDNFANPTTTQVGAFMMVWDGATWDRLPGTAAGGMTVDTELSAAAALSDNFANPTAGGVGSFGMLWDGATWDRAPGTSVDGALVNLGANNDVTVTSGNITADTELPAAAALTDNFANPTAPAVGAFAMVWDGATWDRLPGNSTDGASVKVTNVVSVQFGAAVVTGEVNNFDTSSAVGAAATDDHDYTVTALKTLLLKSITVSASGKMKVIITQDATGTPVVLGTCFVNTALPNFIFEFPQPVECAAGTVLRVSRTNNEASPMDVYSTINGIEV